MVSGNSSSAGELIKIANMACITSSSEIETAIESIIRANSDGGTGAMQELYLQAYVAIASARRRLESVGVDTEKLIVRIDVSKGKQALKDDFNKYFKEKWANRFWNRQIDFYHSWSHSWSGLQIADFVAWGVFQKFERGNDFYVKLIEKKLNITHVWE